MPEVYEFLEAEGDQRRIGRRDLPDRTTRAGKLTKVAMVYEALSQIQRSRLAGAFDRWRLRGTRCSSRTKPIIRECVGR